MAIIGKVKRWAKEAVGGKKTYLPKNKKVKEAVDTARYHIRKAKARIEAAAKKEGHDLTGLTEKAKAIRVAKAKKKTPVRKGSQQYHGASGSDLKELEKQFGKKK